MCAVRSKVFFFLLNSCTKEESMKYSFIILFFLSMTFSFAFIPDLPQGLYALTAKESRRVIYSR